MASTRLTARETAIIVLMAGGHTTPEIADLLDLRTRTVENHKRHIYEKLGVGTQNGAVAEAVRRGLLNGAGHRRWPGEPGRPMLVLVRGAAGSCRDSVVHTLVAEQISFVSVWRGESLVHDHWARWHRGSVLTVLVDPDPDDWSWVVTLNTAVVVVRAGGTRDRLAVVDALAHRASGLIIGDDVRTGLGPALRLAAAGMFAMSWPYTTTLSSWAPPTLTAVPQLTPRERDILGSIARGHTIRQTARTLGIATKTVENTQARLFRKLGSRNRAETLTIARDVGLLDGSTTEDDQGESTDRTLYSAG
ncbi:MAG TPA: LuxR C-terminal-related transcriptional regulator [Pseudonocardiaceae bacterium]|nr:LuxR C-terminal-related transcriptional regulator [Pseudonocardiaceae bacterium]